ncbi:MAG: hypothetical protein ACO3JL_08010, partial [Myxococcota bacterium]
GTPAEPQGLSSIHEWIDVATGDSCTTGEDCGLDDGPAARINHIALSLPVSLGCPEGGAALVGLGRDESGPLDDLWLYVEENRAKDAAGFHRVSGLPSLARFDVAAAVLPGCRVVLAGGQLGSGAVTDVVQILAFTEEGSLQLVEESNLPLPLAGAAVIPLENQLGEVVFLGGYDDDGPVSSASSFYVNAGLVETCALSDGSCNGLVQSLRCPSRFPQGGILSPGATAAAIVIGSDDVNCASVAELLLASETAPYLSLTRLVAAPSTTRLSGFSVTYVPGGALVVGGTGETGVVLPLAEVVQPAETNDEPTAVRFRAVGALAHARSHHAVISFPFATVVAGGFDGSEPSATLELFVSSGTTESTP